jgi:hypothetical protein
MARSYALAARPSTVEGLVENAKKPARPGAPIDIAEAVGMAAITRNMSTMLNGQRVDERAGRAERSQLYRCPSKHAARPDCAVGSSIRARRRLPARTMATRTGRCRRVACLTVEGAVARLHAQRLFDDRTVSAVHADGAGHVLVSHDQAWGHYDYGYYAQTPGGQPTHRLSILADSDLAIAGETDVDSWASLMTAKAGRAIYTVSGGILVVNVAEPERPFAQAYFPTNGWSSELLLDGDDILFASGPYGIHRFNADVFNLLTP